jgi:pimeloyl-ACP methyl ester carboxylesterase
MARLSRFANSAARSRYEQAYNRTLETAGVHLDAHDVPTAFGSTHVIEAGSRSEPPLVLLHTMSFSSTVWVRNLAALSERRRVLAIDTIGDVNLSRSEVKIGGRDDYIEWFVEVLAAFGISRTAIAGNSYGGWLAANFALLRPELVSRVILISPPLVFTKYRPGFYAHLLRAPVVRSESGAKRFARWFVTDETFDDDGARLWLDQFSVGMPFFRGMNGFPRPRGPFTGDELRSLAAPVLLIEGEDEPMHDPRASIERATRFLPSVATSLLPDTKHVAELEHPASVNQLILSHLACDA